MIIWYLIDWFLVKPSNRPFHLLPTEDTALSGPHKLDCKWTLRRLYISMGIGWYGRFDSENHSSNAIFMRLWDLLDKRFRWSHVPLCSCAIMRKWRLLFYLMGKTCFLFLGFVNWECNMKSIVTLADLGFLRSLVVNSFIKELVFWIWELGIEKF